MNFVLQRFLLPLKDFFFPPICFCCERKLSDDESRLCSTCWNLLTPIKEHDYTVKVLQERFRAEGYVSDFYSCFYFEHGGILQKIAHCLKYQDGTEFGYTLGKHLGEKIKNLPQFPPLDGIIPIPLNILKQRERGYNQSNFIAQGISAILHIPFYNNLIKRSKNTLSQTKLTLDERKENIKDAFTVLPSKQDIIVGKSFLVVDDIITTGSTIQAVAKVLKEAKAQRILVASIGLAKLDSEN